MYFKILVWFISVFIISEFYLIHGQEKSEQKCIQYLATTDTVVFPGIVGGEDAKINEFPYIAALGFGKNDNPLWACGGTLISDQYVLTAAHCIYHQELGNVSTVRLGHNILSSNEGTYLKVEKVIKHPNYTQPVKYNDIALLKLDKKLIFANNISPACLESSSDLIGMDVLTAAGWGSLDFAGPKSDKLMRVDLQLYSNEICNQAYKNNPKRNLPQGIVDSTQICAGGNRNESKDTCQGDSGGPLTYKKENVNYIVGVTSFGKACGFGGIPGVYTRVSAYIKWIESIVWPNQ